MTTDFRALCAELLSELEHATHDEYQQDLKDRARTALTEPQPEPPTQRQLLQLAAEFWPEGAEPTQAVPYARAVLARWGTPN